LGHEFCGEIVEVGAKWKDKYTVGQRFAIQPALKGTYDATGYSFANLGGDSTYGIIPALYIEQDGVLPFKGDAFFHGSLAEPLSCVIGAAHANYHTTLGSYVHDMEIVKGGKVAVLAGVGPMGLAMIDYLLHREHKPGFLVVTDIDDARLTRAAEILSPEEAKKQSVELVYLNTGKVEDPVAALKEASGGEGYNDVFVFAPVAPVVEQGDAILAHDGCLNFFAGPSNTEFGAEFNFYNVHYNATHVVGTSGGNTDDIKEALDMSAKGLIDPSILVTHVGGLDAANETTLNLPNIPGGKKLLYTHISLPLTAISDFAEKGEADPLFAKLDELCQKTGGLWNVEAERYLLENALSLPEQG
jgi:threonine dehydrogenase-like Zn-dependent dehydrogenase